MKRPLPLSSVEHDSDQHLDLDHSLPEGWTSAKLGVIADSLTYGYTASASESSHGPRFLRITDIQNGTVDWDSVPTCKIDQMDVRKYGLSPGDIVFARTGATTGKSFLIHSCPLAVFASYLIRLRLLPGINPSVLAYFLQTPEYWTFVSDNVAGIAQPNCNATKLSELQVPIPPSGEQQRLVHAIAASLSKVDAVRDHLSRVPAILKRFRQAALSAACTGKLTADWREGHPEVASASLELERYEEKAREHKTRRGVPDDVECPDDLSALEIPDSWALKSVASLLRIGILKDVKDGNHGSNHPKSAELGDQGLPFITAAQVKNYRVDYDGAPKVNGLPLKRLKVGFAENGDVILTHKGTVGRVAINTRPCVLTPQTTYYRSVADLLDPAYLVYLFTSPFFYSQLAAVMSQTTRDFVPISEQYRLFLLLPPIEEQREISRRVDALFAVANKIEHAMQSATARVTRLSPSILSKAFRGELVSTEAELARREGREYEPASVLLEWIKKEREAQTSSKPERKRKRTKSRVTV